MRCSGWFFLFLLAPALGAGQPEPGLKLLATLEGVKPKSYSRIVFSPDGKTLAVVHDQDMSGKAMVQWWDVAKREKVAAFPIPDGAILSYSPDGKMMYAGTGKAIHRFDVASRKELENIPGKAGWEFLAMSPDGKTAAWTNDGKESVVISELASGKVLANLEAKRMPVFSSAFSPDGDRVVFGCGASASNGQPAGGEIRVIDLKTGKEQATLKGGLVWVWAVAFSPDGKNLASADVYGNVVLWDLAQGKRKKTLQSFNARMREKDINGAYAVAFSPDGDTLAAGTVQGLKLWDLKTGKSVGGVNRPAGTVLSVAFHRDGNTLATAGSKRVIGPLDRIEGDETLRLWEWLRAKAED